MEGRCDDLELTSVTLPHAAKDYSGLLWMGQTRPAGIPLVVRPPPLLVRALLG